MQFMSVVSQSLQTSVPERMGECTSTSGSTSSDAAITLTEPEKAEVDGMVGN
jgi:hypothetical protein